MAPTYDYRCLRCEQRLTARHPVHALRPHCPYCAGPLRPVVTTAPAVHGTMARGREAAIRSLEHPPAPCPTCRGPCGHH
ncbi:MAG: FmdB family zinc ribbon protein [Acidiferrobacter sp.]